VPSSHRARVAHQARVSKHAAIAESWHHGALDARGACRDVRRVTCALQRYNRPSARFRDLGDDLPGAPSVPTHAGRLRGVRQHAGAGSGVRLPRVCGRSRRPGHRRAGAGSGGGPCRQAKESGACPRGSCGCCVVGTGRVGSSGAASVLCDSACADAPPANQRLLVARPSPCGR
jgi:hypothetical protein